MPSKASHVAKAQRNEAALSRFDFEPDQYEWYLTVSFYAAVHWLRAYFAQAGLYTGEREEVTYEDFPRVVARIYRAAHGGEFGPAAAMLERFGELKRLSQRARYGCMAPGWYARQTGDADAALRAIREFVRGEGV
ncbi:hypothetical protein ACFP81_01620 [Deinococcus lacus]|uniref:HEPN domain-containing protein n=1 Tax=Deinococcus lacus TaxID=392561 RepID=A0ABW1Y9F2_9DEIO